jgi:very-short-patch-repair endonuclease
MANEFARALRKRMTPQEVKLWVKLREMRASGLHFRRQVPRNGYVLDFACLRQRMIVEVDGGHHGVGAYSLRDDERDRYFKSLGYRVLRFWNLDIDRNLEGVLETIYREALAPTPIGLWPVDPPPLGEG